MSVERLCVILRKLQELIDYNLDLNPPADIKFLIAARAMMEEVLESRLKAANRGEAFDDKQDLIVEGAHLWNPQQLEELSAQAPRAGTCPTSVERAYIILRKLQELIDYSLELNPPADIKFLIAARAIMEDVLESRLKAANRGEAFDDRRDLIVDAALLSHLQQLEELSPTLEEWRRWRRGMERVQQQNRQWRRAGGKVRGKQQSMDSFLRWRPYLQIYRDGLQNGLTSRRARAKAKDQAMVDKFTIPTGRPSKRAFREWLNDEKLEEFGELLAHPSSS